MSIARSLSPFPSRTIALYTARMFIIRTFAVLTMLVLVLQTLDMLGESGNILAHPGNGQAELWTYIGLRLPQLISRFLPRSEAHTSELQSLMRISYAVFCLTKKNRDGTRRTHTTPVQ